MSAIECPVCFDCNGDALVGILHPAASGGHTGVMIVVGGPQYRIGSHRQFVELARGLAESGIPAFRFDVRGMGDSGGDFPGFEAIDDDIRSAIDAFTAAAPTVERVVLWGLCDGASASLFYAHQDPRIVGAILLNPWVRTESSYAKTELKHYYGAKIADWQFWRRLFTGDIDLVDATASFLKRLWSAVRSGAKSDESTPPTHCSTASMTLPDRMLFGLNRFTGKILLIISGNDLTAREFDEVAGASPDWTKALSANRVTRHDLEESDHTFSREEWTNAVIGWSIDWVAELR
jgi:exosortase A-associated hydrolase 1